MATIPIKSITGLRDDIYNEMDTPGVTAITRSGRFAGVLISAGPLTDGQSRRLLDAVRHNPQHTIELLTNQAIR